MVNAGTSADIRTAEGDSTAASADLTALLGELSDAISVVTVVDRSLAAQELAGAGDEEVTLRYARHEHPRDAVSLLGELQVRQRPSDSIGQRDDVGHLRFALP